MKKIVLFLITAIVLSGTDFKMERKELMNSFMKIRELERKHILTSFKMEKRLKRGIKNKHFNVRPKTHKKKPPKGHRPPHDIKKIIPDLNKRPPIKGQKRLPPHRPLLRSKISK